MYRAITWNVETEGASRVSTARVGSLFDGLRVAAIVGDDPVTIVMEGAESLSIAAGSVVQVEEEFAPAAPRPAPKAKLVATKPPTGAPVGSVIGVQWHEQFGPRTVYVGDSVSYESYVTAIVPGDPAFITLANGRSITVEAGAISHWFFAE